MSVHVDAVSSGPVLRPEWTVVTALMLKLTTLSVLLDHTRHHCYMYGCKHAILSAVRAGRFAIGLVFGTKEECSLIFPTSLTKQ